MDRTRRLRQTAVMRSMVRENHVRTEELIYPLFVMEGENIVQPVESMPGICQYSVDRMNEELDRVKALQIPAILIFGIPEHKDEVGSGAYDEHGIVQTAIRRIKKDYPDLLVIADVCLCEYTSHGHCGLIRDGIILNDETTAASGTDGGQLCACGGRYHCAERYDGQACRGDPSGT